ncbi:Oxidoreductase [Elusimicrobium minutum Pei191]|uniref:Oxidoreductase n=1 Tax=Elusimicrobium minutum (strain Pei191) TaxID=445932 RepID=B2KCN7_ELUMP|nr:dihydroorotate dehydrogenase electron transfer subunit [Elusimicrobium minutum]ACC98283.1 Oxidoreductase [Elusimicrobium minutum Pei191]
MKQIKAEVINISEVKPGIFNILMKAPYIAKNAKAGQFVEVLCNNGAAKNCTGGPLLRRPFGVHNAKGENIEILFKVLGKGTEYLSQKKAGDILDVIGPLGNGFDIKEGRLAVIAGGGMGIAPLLFAAKQTKNPLIFLGARNEAELPCKEKFENLGKLILTTDDGSLGEKCFLNIPLERVLKENKNAVIYACGPHPMLKCLADLGVKYGVEVQVSLEEKMACGIGVCQGCPVELKNKDTKYKLVCKDGPVFNAEDVVW